jgi:hypothetical protein
VPKEPAARSQLSGLASDILSAVLVDQSMTSDAASAAQQANSRILLTQSLASDAHSAAAQASSRTLVVQSLASDIYSAVLGGIPLDASTLSDLRSAITAGGATLTASNISDIASAVQGLLASDLSDVLSAARQTNSRAALVLSQASDIYSLLSDAHSDLGVLSGVISDVYSAASDLGSKLVGLASSVSDVQSAVGALTLRIRKNVALANFEFALVQAADHVSAALGQAVTAEVSLDGAAFIACVNAVAEVGSGIYVIDLDAADLNGDVVTLKFSAAAADTRLVTIVTQP